MSHFWQKTESRKSESVHTNISPNKNICVLNTSKQAQLQVRPSQMHSPRTWAHVLDTLRIRGVGQEKTARQFAMGNVSGFGRGVGVENWNDNCTCPTHPQKKLKKKEKLNPRLAAPHYERWKINMLVQLFGFLNFWLSVFGDLFDSRC